MTEQIMNLFKKALSSAGRIYALHCLLLFSSFSVARPIIQNPEDSLFQNSKNYIELKGQIKFLKGTQNEKGFLDSAVISVHNESNTVVATYLSDRKGKTALRLPLNRQFTLHVSKRGFVTKIVEINTIVTAAGMKNHMFAFDLEIFEKITGLDVSVLQKPIAKVTYNTISNAFNYDYNYTGKINNELLRTYKDYYELQRDLQDAEEYKERVRKKKSG
jgi:hypothetical protein